MNLARQHDPYGRSDELLKQRTTEPLSLNPAQTFATSFIDLERLVVRPALAPELNARFGLILEDVIEAVIYNFPENIFWDFDFLVAGMVKQALATEAESVYFLACYGEKIKRLMELFGNQSTICFRYLHDFLYGFDWAKWVQKAPQAHRHHEPFSVAFLDYLVSRGQELLALIAEDDQKYNRLPSDTYRNPFSFSREPNEEAQLFTQLGAQHLIPVATWNRDACPIWDRPFHELREQLSLELQLTTTKR